MYKFSSDQPVYIQVMNTIKQQIVNGELQENDKIKSVRELALEYGVNPNTVQKSLSELEREGFLRTERTSGRFVTLTSKQRDKIKMDLAEAKTREYINGLRELKYPDQKIRALVSAVLKEKEVASCE